MSFTMSRIPKPSEVHVNNAKEKIAGISLEQLNQGMELYAKHCKGCHFLKNPRKYSESEWKLQVPAMVMRINKKGKKKINSEEAQLILNYVLATGPYSIASK